MKQLIQGSMLVVLSLVACSKPSEGVSRNLAIGECFYTSKNVDQRLMYKVEGIADNGYLVKGCAYGECTIGFDDPVPFGSEVEKLPCQEYVGTPLEQARYYSTENKFKRWFQQLRFW